MKCSFKKTNGKTCGNYSLTNDSFCYWHSDMIPEELKLKARKKGGFSHVIKSNGNNKLYKLDSTSKIMELNAKLINNILQDQLDLRVGLA